MGFALPYVKCFKTLLRVVGAVYPCYGFVESAAYESFMAVTGPKTDFWLVKNVSVLLAAIAVTLLSFIKIESYPLPAILLGGLTAPGLGCY